MQDIIVKKREGEKVEVNKKAEQLAPEKIIPTNPDILEWSMPEYIFKNKSNDWYWSVGIIALALVALAYFINNFFFAVIAIIGGFAMMLLGAKKPVVLNVKVSPKGITINKTIFLMEDIESFCLNEDLPEEPRLFIKLKKGLSRFVSIPINKGEEKRAEDFLKKFLVEETLSESFTLILTRLLGI